MSSTTLSPSPETAQDSLREIQRLFQKPLLDLIHEAAGIHRLHHAPGKVQKSALLSIKTGNCPEDCSYCSQSARYKTAGAATKLMDKAAVLDFARQAKESGASRVCLGSSGRNVKDNADFEQILDMVTEVKALGVETCVTLGMLDANQAGRLKEAGLDFYNHNIDTSPEFYDKIITTRNFQDRLDTLQAVRNSGLSVCTGGILGMGESTEDRIQFLKVLTELKPHPESITINRLVPIPGTPLASRTEIDPLEVVRVIAAARILMPKSVIRLSAGRKTLTDEAQALAFLAGANSIFSGESLLTTPNNGESRDEKLFQKLGLKAAT